MYFEFPVKLTLTRASFLAVRHLVVAMMVTPIAHVRPHYFFTLRNDTPGVDECRARGSSQHRCAGACQDEGESGSENHRPVSDRPSPTLSRGAHSAGATYKPLLELGAKKRAIMSA